MKSYPIDEVLPELIEAIRKHSAVVLQAPPGAGKTTRVPLALLDVWPSGAGRIVMLEPRRIAAVAAARFMTETLDQAPGQTIGYSIRFESRVSSQTRVEVMTEGILTRRLLDNPELKGVGLVIFDEFHERSLQSDLALALCLDIRGSLRQDLKILAMSATLDTAPLAALLGNAPVISSPGKAWPVEEHYLGDKYDSSVITATLSAIRRAIRETSGDILVFLPGAGEIRAVLQALAEIFQNEGALNLSLHPLYGDLPLEKQRQAILCGRQRKIVLATNIAETSLTIEGVQVVIDSGLTRRLQYDAATGMNRLITVRVSQASARQRQGRAGRLGPGVCYRLYSRHDFQSLLPFNPPEILISDLSMLALELAVWGVKDPATLSWLNAPPLVPWQKARELLKELGALDAQGAVSPAGVALARLPLPLRLGNLFLKSVRQGCPLLGADLAALLSERDILRSSLAAVPSFTDGAYLTCRLKILRQWRQDKRLSANANPHRLRAVDAASRQLQRLTDKTHNIIEETNDEQIARLLLNAFPDRIAKRREEDRRYVLRSGRGMKCSAGLFSEKSLYLIAVVVDQGEKAEGIAHIVQPVTEELIRQELGGQIETRRRVFWHKQEERIVAALEERLGAIILSSKPIQPPEEEILHALCEALRFGAAKINFGREALQLQARVSLIKEFYPHENWPDLSSDTLCLTPETWLLPWLLGIRGAVRLAALNVAPALRQMLTWKQKHLLEKRAPESLAVPSGHNIPIDYLSGKTPVLAVKLQELFGLAETPAILDGRVKLLLHLLSPARRPVQITQDIRHFWSNVYPQVKNELKGRYPRHPWPDDPWNAEATRKTKARKQ